MTLLEQREVEARVLAPVYRAFAQELGDERARVLLAEAIGGLAREAGCAAAAAGNSLADLKRVVGMWTAGGALELHVIRDEPEAFEFDVTRCRFAEMYRRLGLDDLGPILSCSRDAKMIEGFNADIGFERTQTLMEGATRCDFRYRISTTA